jgi:hypothetical protein
VRADLGILNGTLILALTVTAAPAARAGLSDDLARCAAIRDDTPRLVCYDQLAAGRNSAPAVSATTPAAPTLASSGSAPVAMVPPPPVIAAGAAAPPAADPQAQIAQFGTSTGPLAAKAAAKRIQSITALVSQVSTRGSGEVVMTLDNDQVWEQNNAAGNYFPIKPGDKVEVSQGALGSFVMWAPSIRRAAKVTRIH